jgi:hypothetical protein
VRQRIAIAAAWVVATVASILVALAGVAGVRTAIADPGSFRLPAEATPAPGLPPSAPDISTTTLAATPQVTEPSPAGSSTSTSVPQTTNTTEDESETETESTVTTTVGQGEQIETYEVEGGWVTIRTDEDGVYFESASPQSGWSADVDEDGPGEVVVIFKSSEEETQFKAKFEDGQVRITIEDEEDDEHDD